MRTVYNLVRHLTDKRRCSKDGKIALAAYLGIKLANVNSHHKGTSIRELRSFYQCGGMMAAKIRKVMREDSELFAINERRNCVFANNCKSDEIKVSRGKIRNEYRGDDVLTIDIPECYKKKERLSMKQLLLLIDYVLIEKEYDDGSGYKYKDGGREAENHCETPEPKSQVAVSGRTSINRTTLGRRLTDMCEKGMLTKKSERQVVKCKPHEKHSFEAVNKHTRLSYWAKCMPAVYETAKGCNCHPRHIIWDSAKRIMSKFARSAKRIKQELVEKTKNQLTNAELEFRMMVERQMEMRFLYD